MCNSSTTLLNFYLIEKVPISPLVAQINICQFDFLSFFELDLCSNSFSSVPHKGVTNIYECQGVDQQQ